MTTTLFLASSCFIHLLLILAFSLPVTAAPGKPFSLPTNALVFATNYYVSPNGNDSNDGQAPERAWRTISKVNNVSFSAGDRILFEGGQTFNGTVQLSSDDAGQANNAVVISSYGSGRALVNGGSGSGIVISGTQYVNVAQINVVGLGRKTGNNHGDGVSVRNSQFVQVEDVEASGFQYAGIRLHASSNVRVVRANAHDNGFAGIFSDGLRTSNRNQNIYVGYSRAIGNAGDPTITNNHSGNGIVFYETSNSLIEYCEAANNGYDQPLGVPNGPVGIWTASADHITIQYSISHNNTSTSADGGGFDFDGGTTDSLIQYCYSYNNKSYGFLVWEYGAGGINNNTIRYSISENNEGPGFLLGSSGAGIIQNIQIYNNIAYSNNYPGVEYRNFGGDAVQNIFFRNNIFVAGAGVTLINTPANFRYENNAYWRTDGGFAANGYSSLSDWANATGQERINGQTVGIYANPQLNNLGNGERLTDPTQLTTLSAYLLRDTSPLINRGLNLETQFGINPGTRDFYGNSIPFGSGFDIGAHEYQGQEPPLPPNGGLLSNSGFESGQGSWNVQSTSVVTNNAQSGTYSARISGTSGGIWYTVNGLQPNTTYTLSGYLKADNANNGVFLYVKNYGSGEVHSPTVTNTIYQQTSVSFTTGANNTSAEIGIWKYSTGSGGAFADDLVLQ